MTLYIAYFFSFCDVSKNRQIIIQDPATPNAEVMTSISSMDHFLNLLSIYIAFTVFYLVYKIIINLDILCISLYKRIKMLIKIYDTEIHYGFTLVERVVTRILFRFSHSRIYVYWFKFKGRNKTL